MNVTRQKTILRKSRLAASVVLACLTVSCPGLGATFSLDGHAVNPGNAQSQTSNQQQSNSRAGATIDDSKSKTSKKKSQPTTLQTVVVTGSIAPRSAADSMSPIDVLTGRELVDTGQPTLGAALRTLLPSFNMPQAAVRGSATANIRPAQLDGLSPDETLVLVNGKPFHTTSYTNTSGFSSGSSPVDLNSIPAAAVARIEVLRDGASTLYGSSAIAGVINIILKGGSNGGFVQASNGVYDGYQGHTSAFAASDGFSINQNGWIRLSANYLRQTPTQQAGPDLRYPQDPTFGKVTMHFGLPYTLAKQFGLNAQYNIGNNATLYVFSLLSKRMGHENATFRSLSQYDTSFPDVVPIVPDGYLPLQYNRILDGNTTFGLRGSIGEWGYDFSVTNGVNHLKTIATNTVNPSLGASSPRAFNNGTTVFLEDDFNADFTRSFDVGLAGPLNFGWGLLGQYQKYIAKAGDPGSFVGAGEGGISALSAGTTSRNDRAVYVDASADVTSKFRADASARYEYYSDFKNNFSWGLKARYAFTPAIALRASYSTGFRAPSVQQEGYSSIGTTFVHIGDEILPFQIGTFQPTSAPAAALGAKPLKPETSQNANIGLVLTPAVGPNITLDVYQIKVKNTIQWTDNLVGPNVVSFLQSQGIEFVNGVRFYTNLTNNRVRGEDFVASWPFSFSDSSFLNFTFALSHYKSEVTSVNPFPALWATIGINPALGRGALIPQPVTKGVASADWTRGPWRLNARLTRYSSFTFVGTTPEFDETFAARYITDVSAAYTLNHKWEFTLGCNDVFNTYPGKALLNTYNVYGNAPYPNDSPYGYFGRYVYATVAYRW